MVLTGFSPHLFYQVPYRFLSPFRPSLIWNMWKGGVPTAAAAVVAVMMVRRMEAQNRLRKRFAPPSIHRFGRNCPMKLAPRGSFVEISFRSSREARSLAKELSHQDVFGNGTRSAAAAEMVTVGNRPPIFPRYRCGWEWPALAVLHSTAENEKGRFWSLEASHSGGNQFSSSGLADWPSLFFPLYPPWFSRHREA